MSFILIFRIATIIVMMFSAAGVVLGGKSRDPDMMAPCVLLVAICCAILLVTA